MPQLNPEFFVSQLFWLLIFFSFLLIFLWRVSLPRIANVLEKRQSRIDQNLSVAKELQEQAQNIETNINNQINEAKEQTDKKIKQTITSLQDEVSTKLSSLDTELEKKIYESEKEIIKNRDSQLKTINEEIIKITKITVSKISDFNLSNSVIDEAVKSSKGSLN